MSERLKRHWSYSEGRAGATSLEPIAIYQLEEEPRQQGRRTKKPPKWRARVLTEVGVTAFDRSFRTTEAAQRYCENHVGEWRVIRRYEVDLDGNPLRRETLGAAA
jgi:hypothetical protein